MFWGATLIAWGLVVGLALVAFVLVAGLPGGATSDADSVTSAIG